MIFYVGTMILLLFRQIFPSFGKIKEQNRVVCDGADGGSGCHPGRKYEKAFSASVLRIFITEKMLCLEAKMPKKKPLMIYKSELTIWLKLSMMMPPVLLSVLL